MIAWSAERAEPSRKGANNCSGGRARFRFSFLWQIDSQLARKLLFNHLFAALLLLLVLLAPQDSLWMKFEFAVVRFSLC